jgi:hypothetical protein
MRSRAVDDRDLLPRIAVIDPFLAGEASLRLHGSDVHRANGSNNGTTGRADRSTQHKSIVTRGMTRQDFSQGFGSRFSGCPEIAIGGHLPAAK